MIWSAWSSDAELEGGEREGLWMFLVRARGLGPEEEFGVYWLVFMAKILRYSLLCNDM